MFAFSVTDRFTDYGTVGVVFIKEYEIMQYVMSCRVLGMEIEMAASTQSSNTSAITVRHRILR